MKLYWNFTSFQTFSSSLSSFSFALFRANVLTCCWSSNVIFVSSPPICNSHKKYITSFSLQWKKYEHRTAEVENNNESFFYSTFRMAFAILVCALSNRVEWKMRTWRCLDARVEEIFYHANELWSPRQFVISWVEHNLLISYIRAIIFTCLKKSKLIPSPLRYCGLR